MIRFVSWIVMAVIGLVVIIFAIANRSPFEIDLWPLPFTPEVPAFAVVLASVFIGFIAGGAITWLSSGTVRRRARQEHRRADSLEKDLGTLKSKIDELENGKKTP